MKNTKGVGVSLFSEINLRATKAKCLWSMVYGLWSMVYGLWSMVYGLWSMVYGLWSMVFHFEQIKPKFVSFILFMLRCSSACLRLDGKFRL
ncbi:hypothetical protein L5M18_16155 [Shewanella sp. SM20]|uniref:hypothetical protein n=1 Tax=Shewanella sp. SM20 TaxID=2912792 RepID=UPI0021D987D0|nr:hypothetical protein [Shewanella sp. SM20]MCU8093089.1 hypothetical protein [Shewanella sp. SM20]